MNSYTDTFSGGVLGPSSYGVQNGCCVGVLACLIDYDTMYLRGNIGGGLNVISGE